MADMTKEQITTPKAKCPDCSREVTLQRSNDGFGHPMEYRPYRFAHHAGNKWGRPCRGSGEQFTGEES